MLFKKHGDKFYPDLFLDQALFDETQRKPLKRDLMQIINACSMASNKMVELVLSRK